MRNKNGFKPFQRQILTCILLITNIFIARAYGSDDFREGDFGYRIKSVEKRTCVVSNVYIKGDIVIPAYVMHNENKFTVVEIGEYAFYQEWEITSVRVPKTITKIGESAFEECKRLTSITLPDELKEIEGAAFRGCQELKTIKFPNQLGHIGQGAFAGCGVSQGNIIIPKSCVWIERGAFGTLNGKNSYVSIPYSKKDLYTGKSCFWGADSLYVGRNIKGLHDDPQGGKFIERSSIYVVPKITFGDKVDFMPEPVPLLPINSIKQIEIGYNITYVPTIPLHITKYIRVRNPYPPMADGFTDLTYVNAILYVPRGSKAQYQKAHAWKHFINIKEYDLHLPEDIEQTIHPVIIRGHECLDMGKLYWRIKNIGATTPYDYGKSVDVCYDSIKAWEKQGWRLPTKKEIKETFENVVEPFPNFVYTARVDRIDIAIARNKKGQVLILPIKKPDYKLEEEYPTQENTTSRSYPVRLVMDKSLIQKQEAEQRKVEQQQRQKENAARNKMRNVEINKLIDIREVNSIIEDFEMRYEFTLEDEYPKHNKESKHIFALRYNTQTGKLFMTAANGALDELADVFPKTKLEGTAAKWAGGDYSISPSLSTTAIAAELNRILKAMNSAREAYNKPILEKKRKREQEQNYTYASFHVSNMLAYPCGATHFNWADDKKKLRENLLSLHPNLRGTKESLRGNISGENVTINDSIEMRPIFAYMNFKPEDRGKLQVQYKYKVLLNHRECTDSHSEAFVLVQEMIPAILEQRLGFSKSSAGIYSISNLKDKISIDKLEVQVEEGMIVVSYHVDKYIKK